MTVKTRLLAAFVAAMAGWLAPSSRAADGLPKRVVLVYTDARPEYKGLSQDDFTRMAAFVNQQGKPVDTLFDGFLIMGLKAKSGGGLVPDFGKPIQSADYDWFLDHIFDEGKQIANLDAAVAALPERLRATREVILCIPYPLEKQANDARAAIVSHYLDEARRRFEQGHFAHLHLNGFYWVQETVSGKDIGLVKEVAKAVHARPEKFYWIPYFDAAGEPDWRTFGFDCAMLQPNYAFRDVKPARFDGVETKCQNWGLTVEMEVAHYTRNRPESPARKDSFLKYISAGITHHWATLDCVGYYNANDLLKMSRNPAEYPYYELIHKFVNQTATAADLKPFAEDANGGAARTAR